MPQGHVLSTQLHSPRVRKPLHKVFIKSKEGCYMHVFRQSLGIAVDNMQQVACWCRLASSNVAFAPA